MKEVFFNIWYFFVVSLLLLNDLGPSSCEASTPVTSECGSDYIFVPEEGVYFKKVTDTLVTYNEARAICRNEGNSFFIPNPNFSAEETAQHLLNAGVLPSTDALEVGSNYPGIWTTALFRTRQNIYWHPYEKRVVEIPSAQVSGDAQNGTNYGVILKWNDEFEEIIYTTLDMEERALYTCVCSGSPPATPATTTTTVNTPTATPTTVNTPTTSPTTDCTLECEPGDIYVQDESLCFTKISDELVTYREARDICYTKGNKFFIPNPEISAEETSLSLLVEGVLPTEDEAELGRLYPGIWTTVLFRTRQNEFWHPYEKVTVEIPSAVRGSDIQNGTNYGVILKWDSNFEQRVYTTFGMEEKALYTCTYPPTPCN